MSTSAAGHQHQLPPTSLSRYRSLGGNSVSSVSTSATAPSVKDSVISRDDWDADSHSQGRDSSSGSSTTRSMSRYRKRPAQASINSTASFNIGADPPSSSPPPPAVPPPVPALPQHAAVNKRTDSAGRHEPITQNPARAPHRRCDSGATPRPLHSRSIIATANKDDDSPRMTDREGATLQPEQLARLEADSGRRLLAEQKKKDLERLQLELSNSAANHQSRAPKPRSPIFEKFSQLTKGRKTKESNKSHKDVLSSSCDSPTSATFESFEPRDFPAPRTESLEKESPDTIQAGGINSVPRIDAPVSAINAGDRNVTVRCRHHTFSMEVTPETTANDVLTYTSNKMSYDLEISLANCVVVESYGSMGLDRHLRRYERIREVMNSWDRDSQNVLVVSVVESGDDYSELEVACVPALAEPPRGFQLHMYHCNRPGKWTKKYITLHDNGQISCAKKPNAKIGEKDVQSLCHLSDYDIYTPNEATMRRQLKPPKKYCYAVRSQQKTSVFLNAEDYVQYFCTEDPQTAAEFRGIIQRWRSWYLVDRNPDVRSEKSSKATTQSRETDQKPPRIGTIKHAQKKSTNVAAADGHQLRVSVDETPYNIGHFEPLLDMKRFDKRLSQFGKEFIPNPSDSSRNSKGLPSYLKTENDLAFTGQGLLGNGYEERKKLAVLAENDGVENGKPSQVPYSAPANKAQGSWFPSALEHSAKQRTDGPPNRPKTSSGVVGNSKPPFPSVRIPAQAPPQRNPGRGPTLLHPNPLRSSPTSPDMQSTHHFPDMPKPLVNLSTPSINISPAPQHNRRGHGVKVPEGIGYLVDAITYNEEPGKGANTLSVPPRSAMRPTRMRSKSSSNVTPGRDPVPAVPSLPLGMGKRAASGGARAMHPEEPEFNVNEARDRIERERERYKEREREKRHERDREEKARMDYNPSARAGTLKAV